MPKKRFGSDGGGLKVRFDAQRLAFAPVLFEVTRLLRSTGLLGAVSRSGEAGVSAAEAAREAGLSGYAAQVLLESGLSADLVALSEDDRYSITALGEHVLTDEMVGVNLEFMHEICYLGMHRLEESLREGRPAGLAALGPYPTIYEGLAALPERARKAWLDFDHFYSDRAFAAAARVVLATAPRDLLDVGCNTGKWASLCLRSSPSLRVSLVDLPGQVAMAIERLQGEGVADRADPRPVDVLDPEAPFPGPHDAVWMSQFLECFSPEQARSILRRAACAVRPGGRVWVLDTFWDRQRFDVAAFCIMNTSPYFTAIACGNSRMYRASEVLSFAADAGLSLQAEHGPIGLYHTLLELAPR